MTSADESRPGYHFTPHRHWMNDPNGLVYHDGVYHMYFQYNPVADIWGNMSWGHATSADLVTWTEQPVAIPCSDSEQIFSGSVVVDHRNTSGFGTDEKPPLVAIYTSAFADGRQAQSLAYSTDSGMTWISYDANPVLDRESFDFRDPKVFWHGAGYWVMVVAEARDQQILFYRSDDLRRWNQLSTLGPMGGAGLWECPDLFALPLDGDTNRMRWILLISVNPIDGAEGSFACYVVGDFDGISFVPSGELRRLDHGRDFYAVTSFDNEPAGRRIVLGWMSNWAYADQVPTTPWRGTMSLPRELGVATVDGVPTLGQRPVMELHKLEGSTERVVLDPFDLVGARSFDVGQRYRIDVVFDPVDADCCGVDLLVGDDHMTRLSFDVTSGHLALDRTRSGEIGFSHSFASTERAPIDAVPLRVQVFVDRTSVEVFARDGAITLTDLVFPASASTGLRLWSRGGTTRVRSFECVPLLGVV